MLRRIGAEEGGEFKAVASGTLPSGKPVIVNSDGTVAAVANVATSSSAGTPVVYNSSNTPEGSVVFDSSNNKIVVAYRDAGDSSKGKAVVGTVSGTSISFGTPVEFESGNTPYIRATFDSSNNKVVIAYQDADDSSYGKAIVGTVSGTSISFGSAVTFESSSVAETPGICFDSTNNKVVISYRDGGNSNYGTAIVGTVSGTSISFGSATVFRSGNCRRMVNAFDSVNGKVVIAYRDYSDGSAGDGIVGTVSGTSISFGSPTEFNDAVDGIGLNYDVQSGKMVVSFQDDGGFAHGIARVGTVSGTSISFGTEVTYHAASTSGPEHIYDPTTQKTIIAYRDNASGNVGEFVEGTVSGTSITFSSPVQYSTSDATPQDMVYDTNAKKAVVIFENNATSNRGEATVITPGGNYPNLTSENYIGMSRGVAVQTGSAASVGSDVVFASASTNQIASTFDSNSNRIVIAYRDAGNSNHGTAIVGTISGSSISFGSEVVFNSGSTTEISMTFYDDTNRVIIAYKDAGNSDYGTAIVGSVDSSDNSISFGTATVFESAHTTFTSVVEDSNADKVVICYNDVGNSNAGTAIVGTISGTSISFGSANTFESGNTERISTTFDSNSNKFVVAFVDAGDSNKGKARVGTVSGTGTSFGSTVEFESGTVSSTTMTFDSSNNKVVIAIRGSSDVGKAYVGTVSGTSISFGSAVNFTSGSNDNRLAAAVFDTSVNKVVIAFVNSNTSISAISGTVSGTSISFDDITTVKTGNNLDNLTAAFDSNANKVFIGYRDVNSSNHGTANIFTTNTVATTRAEVADGGNASMDIIGSVSTNQIGLTAGQQYFVQNDGTISTTADSPSVLAGTAISATELVVKT